MLVGNFSHIVGKQIIDNQEFAKLIVDRFYMDPKFFRRFDYTKEEREKIFDGLEVPEIESAVILAVKTQLDTLIVTATDYRTPDYYDVLKNYDIDQTFIDTYLIGVDKLTLEQMLDLDYVSDRIEAHKSMLGDDDYNDFLNPDFESEGIKKLTTKFGGMFVDRDVHESYGSGLWIDSPKDNYNVGNFVVNDHNTGDFKYISIMDDGSINVIKVVEYEEVDQLIDFIDSDLVATSGSGKDYAVLTAGVQQSSNLDNLSHVDRVIDPAELVDLKWEHIATTDQSKIDNYSPSYTLAELVFPDYMDENESERTQLTELIESNLKLPNGFGDFKGKSGDKKVPTTLLKQLYNLAKQVEPTAEWVQKYEYLIKNPPVPELKIKYVAVDKTTYETDKSGLEFTIEINGIKAKGYWTPKGGGYNPQGVDINEIQFSNNGYDRIKIFNGGGTAKSYEISSYPTKKEKQPKDLRFTGEYYDTAPMGIDFVNKIREGLKGPTKSGATLTPEFLKYFRLD